MSKKPSTDYRVVLYDDVAGPARYVYPERPADDNVTSMVELLEHYVESGYAVGGHIEEQLERAGLQGDWVVCLSEDELWR